MIENNFLLESDFAVELYEKHAKAQPIIDYHNHLNPQMIAEDYSFGSISEVWLGGDHYKWRALRANGVDERFVTGDAGDWDKFQKWAETIQYTMRNPLYHWTHLELQRYFGISEVLNPSSAKKIYDQCNAMLKQKEFSVRGLLNQMNVEVLCTTDDPIDDLRWHKAIAEDKSFKVKVYPSWRPDKVMMIDGGDTFRDYIKRLGEVAGVQIKNFADLLTALSRRQEHFAAHGCKVADHGFNDFPDKDFTESGLETIFAKALKGEAVTADEAAMYKSGMIFNLAKMNNKMGWAQQFHIGAIRNNNRKLFKKLGPDVGCDSMADDKVAAGLSRILGKLDEENSLTRTVVYNLNPKDSEVLMSMVYNFNDGSVPGKMQYGAAWWFLDQLEGMRQQLEILSHGGLLSRFVGMLTDSRSFLSFPRHEYFRRILCNELGNDLKRGLLPKEEMPFIGKMTADICYNNAKEYFKF